MKRTKKGKLEYAKDVISSAGEKAIEGMQHLQSNMASLSPDQVRLIEQKKASYYQDLEKNNKRVVTMMNEYAMRAYKSYLSALSHNYSPINNKYYYNSENRIRYFDITKWVIDKEEKNIEKLINVYQVLSQQECNIALIYERTKSDCNVKIAISNISLESDDTTIADQYIYRILKSIKGNFPGVQTSSISDGSPIKYTNEDSDGNRFYYSIAAISNLASDKSEDFISQNMEKLLDGIVPTDENNNYTIVLLASPNRDVSNHKVTLSTMYSELSSFSQWQTNYAISEGTMLGAGANIGASAGANFGFQGGLNIAKTINEMKQQGKNEGETYSFTNYAVKHLLDTIEKQMARLDESDALGMWNFAAYAISPDFSVAEDVAHMYLSLTQGKESFVSQAAINMWDGGYVDDNSAIATILHDVSELRHPRFAIKQEEKDYSYPFPVDLTTVLSGKDMARALNLPRKSVAGLPVVESIAFGREVFKNGDYDTNRQDLISIGKIYHMHAIEEKDVVIDRNSLCSHVFVTGSTGKGKSNCIYKILEKVSEKGHNDFSFMVIEPAKGEYKDAFYKHPSIEVQVLGTNPKESELLRINPFTFPDSIHVLEHIDRLSEIFNACWPMYAAMPAILKNAIIRSYERCGWDTSNSVNDNGEYPNFDDVLSEIKLILKSSAFSDDNKGDYTGALCTRVESLTKGLNGLLFGSAIPVSDEELFAKNTIVDLSRIGSPETKSLIMSLLVMKLQEYRLNEKKGANLPLRHITVLEEAHNILKRTNTDQSTETSNVTGKAVEVLSNAIAEMRTYGESFIIADQAPSLLDISVIRNTNTKIILCLPDEEDRLLTGKSIGLSDKQISELSKLERGVAAVYQNDWQEAVLCKFDKYHKDYSQKQENSNYPLDNEQYSYHSNEHIKTPSEARIELLKYLLSKVISIDEKIDFDALCEDISICGLQVEKRRSLTRLVEGVLPSDIPSVSSYVSSLFDMKALFDNVLAQSIEEWNDLILQKLDPELMRLRHEYQNNLIQCLMYEQSRLNNEFIPYTKMWVEYMEEKAVK